MVNKQLVITVPKDRCSRNTFPLSLFHRPVTFLVFLIIRTDEVFPSLEIPEGADVSETQFYSVD